MKTTSAPISTPIIARKRKDAVMLLTKTTKSKNAAPTTVKAEPAIEAKGSVVKYDVPLAWISSTPPMKNSATKTERRRAKAQWASTATPAGAER